MLIIGCGNRDRGDDAAGVLVAEALRARGAEVVLCRGEATELMDAWQRCREVLVVDAVVSGAEPGSVMFWTARDLPAFSTSASSTHAMGLAQAIELDRILGRLPHVLRVCAIEGRDFTPGADLSPEVARAVELAVEEIAAELAQPVAVSASATAAPAA